MSLPINALKDDELLHYSQFDSGAADELARRLATGDLHIVDELSELEEYARELEEGKEEADDDLEVERAKCRDAIAVLEATVQFKPKTVDDALHAIRSAIEILEG
ncbi:hypothetical protein [Pseudomonas aeruginosa]|uniref:Uncharacterized protein n=2 Tax=Pseudomonas aeruginosa TaxID=287 RepID=B3G2J5_PSEAI|nr:hypothetical protein [Pseudomonas aeruginosa]ACD39257.1 hypothetical protein PACL_0469 [Pseudomonas aeruginosa]EIU3463807.1 hypothetical protein [Pseudomonas aeruginosa]EIU4413795.1 hypothetical protein [Pseudomonas aeruginosa]EIU7143653.1 hypothetical protein [Pseudomonas aeruginosa]EIZ0545011.1 hypothetical protein [Pseudomonas aeruginosa]